MFKAPILALLVSGTAVANPPSSMDIDFELAKIPGQLPCYITQPPIFAFEGITETGVYEEEIDVAIKCESDLPFTVHFARSPTYTTSGHIYRDNFIQVYAGTKSTHSADGTVFTRGYRNLTGDGCIKNSSSLYWTRTINAGGHTIYPIGSDTKYNTYLSNKNACWVKESHGVNGEHVIRLHSILVVNEVPKGDEVDDIPTTFSLPITLTARIEVPAEEE